MTEDLLPVPVKIESADIYRDGGSYGISFFDSDNIYYELFLEVRHDRKTFEKIGYMEPVLHIYDTENFGKIKQTKQLNWKEGAKLSEKLQILCGDGAFYDDAHARSLFEFIDLEGNLSRVP